MYVPQHAAAPQRGKAGRHRRPSRVTGLMTPALASNAASASTGSGNVGRESAAVSRHAPVHTGAAKGPRIASGVSALTVGAAGFFGMAAPAHADGETLNFQQIAGVVKDAGLPCVSGTAIAYAESSGDTDINSNFPGEDSRGLFQINEAHGFDFDWDDARANANMAKDIYDDAGGWSPWGAYTNGSYKNYLDDARSACGNATQVSSDNDTDGADAEPAVQRTSGGKHRKGGGESTYSVESGDTLSGIARDRGTTWKHLMEMNSHIDDPNVIHPGDEIDVTGHPVQ